MPDPREQEQWKNVVEKMQSNNILYAIDQVKTQKYPRTLYQKWLSVLPSANTPRPEANMDLAGKWPLALKLYDLGLLKHCYIDCAHAGGLLTQKKYTPDGILMRDFNDNMWKYLTATDAQLNTNRFTLIEVKSARRAKSAPNSQRSVYTITIHKRLFYQWIMENTMLFVVLRKENPADWEDLRELENNCYVGCCRLKDLMLQWLLIHNIISENIITRNTYNWDHLRTNTMPRRAVPKSISIHITNEYHQTGENTQIRALSAIFEWVKLGDLSRVWIQNNTNVNPQLPPPINHVRRSSRVRARNSRFYASNNAKYFTENIAHNQARKTSGAITDARSREKTTTAERSASATSGTRPWVVSFSISSHPLTVGT